MRVLLATDSFKGTISAADAVAALAAGWHDEDPAADLVAMPMADGGEGTLAAFAAAVPGAERVPITVTGPADLPVETHWLRLPPTADAPGGTGVVELAATSGIELLDELRPWDAHTLGLGEAVAAALDGGVSRLIVGIGSSSSTDGGSGLLRALGARLLDERGGEAPLGLRGLERLASIELSGFRAPVDALVITDVASPLAGPRGAAAVFGPQKGLRSDEIERADRALSRYAELVRTASPGAGLPDPAAAGAGAAGGTGFGLLAWGARLVPGAAEIAELIGLERALETADLVVTGEGAYDGQSGEGKAPAHVSRLARRAGVPVALVAGVVADDAETQGFAEVLSLAEIAGGAHEAMADPAGALAAAGRRLARSKRRDARA